MQNGVFSGHLPLLKNSETHKFLVLAPSIYENDDIKKGILCQLFGGTNKDFSHAGRGRFRWVLLVWRADISSATFIAMYQAIMVNCVFPPCYFTEMTSIFYFVVILEPANHSCYK